MLAAIKSEDRSAYVRITSLAAYAPLLHQTNKLATRIGPGKAFLSIVRKEGLGGTDGLSQTF